MSTAVASRASSSAHTPTAAPDTPCSLLRMAVGTDVLAVPIEDVREILQVARMTPLPRTPGFIRGVMNLRGAVVPVIDLAARLGQGHTTLGRRSCVVVVQTTCPHDAAAESATPPVVMGLLVDAVFEVFDRSSSEIEAAPALGTHIEPQYLRGITRAGGQLISVLSLAHVLSTQSLASSIASHVPH
jgi:purine-binding chemotaxis protein CheW